MELLTRSQPDADLQVRTDNSMRVRRRLRLIMLAGSCIIIGMATRFGEIAFTLKSKAALKQINRFDSFILNNEVAQPPKENVVFCGSKHSHNYDLSTRVHQPKRKIQCDAVLNLFTTCIEATHISCCKEENERTTMNKLLSLLLVLAAAALGGTDAFSASGAITVMGGAVGGTSFCFFCRARLAQVLKERPAW